MIACNLDWIHTAGTERFNEKFSMKLENRGAGTGGYEPSHLQGSVWKEGYERNGKLLVDGQD